VANSSMVEVARATVTIIPNMKGSQATIAKDLGAEASEGGKKAGKSAGSAIIKGLAAAGITAAVGKFFTDSIGAGGELQQNLGGTEAVFGEFAKTIQADAEEAYKNMGMSASDYMATANKMGSLFQGSGMDQKKSLELTSAAMRRAADVASVMGLDTSAAMESIAGAAKGNFTMMDNLGVAMNATTLQAYALEKGVNFDWDTADNAAKAELAMQMFMDRTTQYEGNFARESEETFSGSIGAVKSAAENLMANLALGNDITPYMTKLSGSIKSFVVGNLLPMIGNIASQIPAIIGQLPGFLADMIPDAIPVIVDMVADFAKAVVDNIPVFLDGITKLFGAIWSGLENVDWIGLGSELLSGLSTAVGGIWDSVVDLFSVQFGVDLPDWRTVTEDISSLWDRVKEGIADFFKTAFDIITDNDKTITEKISGLWDLVKEGISGFFEAYFDIVLPAAETLVSTISEWWGENVWPSIQDFFKTTFGVDLPNWEDLTKPIKEGWETVKEGIEGLFSVVFGVGMPSAEDVIGAIDTLWSGVWDGITGFFNVLFGLSIPTWEDVKESITNFWEDVKTGIDGFFKKTFGVDMPSWEDVTRSIDQVWTDVKEGIKSFFKKTFGVSMPSWEDVIGAIKTGWNTVKEGIGGFFSWLFSLEFPSVDDIVSDLKDWWNSVVEGIGDFFTLDWILGSKENEEVYEEFSGAGRKFEINDDTVNIDSEAIQKALSDANLKLSDIDTSSLDVAKKAVTDAVSAMEASFTNSKVAVPTIGTTAITAVKNAITKAVSSFQSSMNFYWSLPALHGRLPIISVTMNETKAGKSLVNIPSIGVSGYKWFAEGGIFNKPQVIGIGDSKGPEAAVPLDKMWERMSQEFDKHLNGGATVTNYFQVDGAQDPEAWAMNAARTIKRELRMA